MTRANYTVRYASAAALTAVALLDAHLLGRVGGIIGRGLYAALGAAAWAVPLWLADEARGAWNRRPGGAQRRLQWAGGTLLALVALGLGSCGGRLGGILAGALERSIGLGAYLVVLTAFAVIAVRVLGRGRVSAVCQAATIRSRDSWPLFRPRRSMLASDYIDVVASGESHPPLAGEVTDRQLPPPLPRVRAIVSLPVVASASPSAAQQVDRGAVAQQLTQQLWLHGVTCNIRHAMRGPMVDLFKLTLGATQKLAPIEKLQKELEMQHAGLRLCPMPGSGHLGIEIPLPASEQRVIALSEVMQSDAWRRSDAALPLALGLTSVGEPIVIDLAKAPHLLVAGATGSGKSVGLNVMLYSLLLAHGPSELRLLLIDPKRVALARYREIPHLIAPPATEIKDAITLLNWACSEMDQRYEMFVARDVDDLELFNALGDEQLPRVVVVIDEYADLAALVGKEVEPLVARIAALGRGAGIHVILATQRPSVDVVTGVIKANFPARIAYKVAQREDSKTVLGVIGAQQLLGRGDSLCLLPPATDLLRVHSAFVSPDDIRAVCDSWRAKGTPEYAAIGQCGDESPATEYSRENPPEPDDYERAIACAQERGHVSIRQLQDELGCGFKRAQGLFERMKSAGLLEPGGPNNAMRFVG